MSQVKVTRKRAPAAAAAPLFGLVAPIAPFLTIPLALMRGVAEEVDHAFGASPGAQAGSWTPPIDYEQSEGNLVVTAELPGLTKDEVEVELVDHCLVIKGEYNSGGKTERQGVRRLERRRGQFYRSIALPDGARTEHMKTELHDGILELSMPVAAKKGRHIPVDRPAAA